MNDADDQEPVCDDALKLGRIMVAGIRDILDKVPGAKFKHEGFLLAQVNGKRGKREPLRPLPEWIPDELREDILAYLTSIKLGSELVGSGEGEPQEQIDFCLGILTNPECKGVWRAISKRQSKKAFQESQIGSLLSWAHILSFGIPSFDAHPFQQRAKAGTKIHKLASQLANELQAIRSPEWLLSSGFPPPIADAIESKVREAAEGAAHSYARMVATDAAESAADVARSTALAKTPTVAGAYASVVGATYEAAYDGAYVAATDAYKAFGDTDAGRYRHHAYGAAELIAGNPEKLLRAIADNALEWSKTKPVITHQTEPDAARRLYFIRELVGYFRKYYDQPLWDSVASLTNAIFNCDLTASDISALCRSRPPRKRVVTGSKKLRK